VTGPVNQAAGAATFDAAVVSTGVQPSRTAPTSATLVQLQDASVRLGSMLALRGVTLRLQRGDRLMLVGANGSGKTTLIRLLHGLVQPLNPGQRVANAAGGAVGGSAPLRMAMVFQRPFLLSLSVRNNLLVALWLQGVARSQRAALCQQALERVGLARLAALPARALSGGQQQRLALARAWALKPDILFLDEPTASLDPGAKREIEALIQAFGDSGVTLVMSTHNLGQAKRLGTRVAYLEAGELVVDREVQAFFSGPELPERARQFLKGELPWDT
jgi:tungstate transport system ATP-binding protein